MSEEEKKKRRKLQKVSFILSYCELDTSLLTKSTVNYTNNFTIDSTKLTAAFELPCTFVIYCFSCL